MRSALLLLLSVSCVATFARADEPPCRVESPRTDVHDVTLTVDESTFDVSVEGAHVFALPGRRMSALAVEAEVAFAGVLANDAVPYVVRPGAVSIDGLVHVGQKAWRPLRLDAGSARFTALFEPRDNIKTERIAWTCEALALGPLESDRDVAADASYPGYDKQTARPSLRVHGAPDGLPYLTLQADHAPVMVLERRASYLKIRVALDFFGAYAEGWTDAYNVTDGPRLPAGHVTHASGRGHAGTCDAKPQAGDFFGPIRVRRDATVHAGRARVAWARATPTESWLAHYHEGDEWVRVREIPRLRSDRLNGCDENRIWVRRADVTLDVSQKHGLTIERRANDATNDATIVVTALTPRSHWDDVGLRVGDRIVAFDTTRFDASSAATSLSEIRRTIGCGNNNLTVQRNGAPITLRVPQSCPGRSSGKPDPHDFVW